MMCTSPAEAGAVTPLNLASFCVASTHWTLLDEYQAEVKLCIVQIQFQGMLVYFSGFTNLLSHLRYVLTHITHGQIVKPLFNAQPLH